MLMKFQLPQSTKNMITLTGALLAMVGICVFWAMFLLAEAGLIPHGSYFGLVLYMILPVPTVIGLLLIPLGMYKNRQQAREKRKTKPYPVIDLNIPRHRNAAVIFSGGTIFMGFFVLFLSYQGFHYTESTEFCGTLCHSVMEPEYATYLQSPHARVPCVKCHVGAGAGWYARSKLSGLYQVYATIFDKFPRPIETPIKNLRPARETCEQCHWPEKLFDAREKRLNHYIEEEENYKLWTINMLIEIGGQSADYETHPGSHWHIHPDVTVEYIAVDEKRLDIPWVRLTNKATGKQVVFQSGESPVDDDSIADYEIRTMDCMDCHNRPTHIFTSPVKAVNTLLYDGILSPELPDIKIIANELLKAEYTSADSAVITIKEELTGYYEDNYPETAREMKDNISKAANGLTEYYSRNFFPFMKSQWDIYPQHLGHFEFPGCYRCHDGMHMSETGRPITNSCNDCHIILSQGDQLAPYRAEGLEFKHPVDIDEAWKEMPCYDCHSPENY